MAGWLGSTQPSHATQVAIAKGNIASTVDLYARRCANMGPDEIIRLLHEIIDDITRK